MLIRKATKNDAQAAWDIRAKAVLHECAANYPAEIIKKWTEGSEPTEQFVIDVELNFFVSVVKDSVVGFGKLTLETSMIDAIFVDPAFTRKGFAKAMMNHLEDIAREHKLPLLKLDSSLNAVTFYHGCGFVGEKIGTYISSRGIALDSVAMSKKL